MSLSPGAYVRVAGADKTLTLVGRVVRYSPDSYFTTAYVLVDWGPIIGVHWENTDGLEVLTVEEAVLMELTV